MKIYLEQQNKKLNKKFNGSAKKLLGELRISASAVLIIKNGELVTEDELLKDKDDVKLLSVVSGG
ncbi:MAG TPA: MoaD/ThiS family protein [Candidatus Nanoarchaeia archaeon]|nr:MoaD/ThiS family protein [Candidatus Nanoarchaeia archaeon]